MSPYLCYCVICGSGIDNNFKDGWTGQYRLVCRNSEDTWISGVGLYNSLRSDPWNAPQNFDQRWTDEGSVLIDNDTGVLAVMWLCNDWPVTSFIIHEACWSLLSEIYYKDSVSAIRLFDICESLTYFDNFDGLNWGHSYGGLLTHKIRKQSCDCTWQSYDFRYSSDGEIFEIAQEDPYSIPKVKKLLKNNLCKPFSSKQFIKQSLKAPKQDAMHKLPWELIVSIACLLPMKDIANLRLASKAFGNILIDNVFWHSRFNYNMERGYLFEARDYHGALNWRELFFATRSAMLSKKLQNRERIWKIMQLLRVILDTNLSFPEEIDLGLIQNMTTWKHVEGKLVVRRYNTTYGSGCMLDYEQVVPIAKNVTLIGITVLQLEKVQYVRAIRLVNECGESTIMGYWNSQNESLLEASGFRGFSIAFDHLGIRGLRVLIESKQSDWIGDSEGSLLVKELASSEALFAIKVGFDEFKLVRLGIPCDQSEAQQTVSI